MFLSLQIPLFSFGLGALLVTIASGITYFQNLFAVTNVAKGKEVKDVWNYFSIGLVIASYFLSLFGLVYFVLLHS